MKTLNFQNFKNKNFKNKKIFLNEAREGDWPSLEAQEELPVMKL